MPLLVRHASGEFLDRLATIYGMDRETFVDWQPGSSFSPVFGSVSGKLLSIYSQSDNLLRKKLLENIK